MKKIILFFFLLGFTIPALSQQQFEFVDAKSDRVKFPIRLINNLVFIPVKVNGVELLFLLDSGVEETILFGFEDPGKLNLNNVKKINIQGLGDSQGVEGLRSSGNLLTIDKLQSKNHMLYLILDPSFNLSTYVGITVNGIIGSAAFNNHLVEIDYAKRMVSFHKLNSKFHVKIQKEFTRIPLSIERNKPYVKAVVRLNDEDVAVKLLVDNGNSDAIWLFDEISDKIEVPQKHFKDYLGQGLSGAVEGKRARIDRFSIADFQFKIPIVAFPDSISIKNISMQSNRLGSVGGEILKRFTSVFDYKNGCLYLKKNKNYKNTFYYNKSGIEVWHTGVQLVKQLVVVPDNSFVMHAEDIKTDKTAGIKVKYKTELKPVYEIGYIRMNSNAEKCGLKIGDIIVSIDGKEAYNLSLQQLNALLWSDDEIWIEVKVEREGKLMDFKFKLIDVL
ncbi:PDZ domain-containing protein [Flavobacterium flavipallidum]|uniref:PDZ domain-containing protein n=1 Tax=Flavobacterium flavipallidum TaxID=3139140 RepID=A0ABU9HKP3_9FLAO